MSCLRHNWLLPRMSNQPTAKRAILLLFTAYANNREPGERMREQQSGLGKRQHLPYDPHLQSRLLAAAARRQAQYEAIHEADPSYGGQFAGTHPEPKPYRSTQLSHIKTGRNAAPPAPVTFDAEDDYELEED